MLLLSSDELVPLAIGHERQIGGQFCTQLSETSELLIDDQAFAGSALH
jgi:hypothetical protein